MFNPVYGPGPGPGPSHRMSNHRYSTSSRHSSIRHLPVIEEDLTLAEKTALRPLVSALFWFPASPPQTHHHFGGGSSAVGCLYDSSGVEDNVVENAWVPPMMNGRTSRQRTRRRRTRLWYYRRRPVWLERRGGWRRLALFATFVLVCVVGLILGLTLGLRRKYAVSLISLLFTIPLAYMCVRIIAIQTRQTTSQRPTNSRPDPTPLQQP